MRVVVWILARNTTAAETLSTAAASFNPASMRSRGKRVPRPRVSATSQNNFLWEVAEPVRSAPWMGSAEQWIAVASLLIGGGATLVAAGGRTVCHF
jgi:hypothetical protein